MSGIISQIPLQRLVANLTCRHVANKSATSWQRGSYRETCLMDFGLYWWKLWRMTLSMYTHFIHLYCITVWYCKLVIQCNVLLQCDVLISEMKNEWQRVTVTYWCKLWRRARCRAQRLGPGWICRRYHAVCLDDWTHTIHTQTRLYSPDILHRDLDKMSPDKMPQYLLTTDFTA